MLGEPTPQPVRMGSPFHQSQKLMRCEVVNRYREGSVRFVELDAFKLPAIPDDPLHGLRIGEPTLCLWIDAGEYAASANLFDRAGKAVSGGRPYRQKLFDAEYGFSQTIMRYARGSRSSKSFAIPLAIPAELLRPFGRLESLWSRVASSPTCRTAPTIRPHRTRGLSRSRRTARAAAFQVIRA